MGLRELTAEEHAAVRGAAEELQSKLEHIQLRGMDGQDVARAAIHAVRAFVQEQIGGLEESWHSEAPAAQEQFWLLARLLIEGEQP